MHHARDAAQVVELAADECESGFDFVRVGELLGLRELGFERGEQRGRVEEAEELHRVGEVLAAAAVDVGISPRRVARAEVARVEFDGVVELVVELEHRRGGLAERRAAELMHEHLGLTVGHVIEHPAHRVIDRAFQALQRAGAVLIDGLDAIGDEPLRLRLDETGRAHRRVARAEVRAPVVDVAGETLRHDVPAPRGEVVVVRAGEHDLRVGRKLQEGLRRVGGEDVARHVDHLARMRGEHALGELAVQNPELLAPVAAGVEELRARAALAGAEAIGLAEVHGLITGVEPADEVLVKQLLHLGIGNAVLGVHALGVHPLAAEEREVFRVRGQVFLRRHGALPSVPTEGVVHAGKAVVRDFVKAAARRIRGPRVKHRRLHHVQVRRHCDPRRGQELEGRRREQVQPRRVLHRLTRREVGIEEAHAEVLPQKLRHALRRADAVPLGLARAHAWPHLLAASDDDVAPADAQHVAPALELRDRDALLPGERGVAEENGGLGGVAFGFEDNRQGEAVGLEGGLQQARGLLKAVRQGLSRRGIGDNDLIIRLPLRGQNEIRSTHRRDCHDGHDDGEKSSENSPNYAVERWRWREVPEVGKCHAAIGRHRARPLHLSVAIPIERFGSCSAISAVAHCGDKTRE